MEYPIPVTVVQFSDSEAFRTTAHGVLRADGGVQIERPFAYPDGHAMKDSAGDIEFCELVLPDGSIRRDFFEVKPVSPVLTPAVEATPARWRVMRNGIRYAARQTPRFVLVSALCCADLVMGSASVDADVPTLRTRHVVARQIVDPEQGARAVIAVLAFAFGHPRE